MHAMLHTYHWGPEPFYPQYSSIWVDISCQWAQNQGKWESESNTYPGIPVGDQQEFLLGSQKHYHDDDMYVFHSLDVTNSCSQLTRPSQMAQYMPLPTCSSLS